MKNEANFGQTTATQTKINDMLYKINENGKDITVDEQAYVEYLIRMAIVNEIEFDENNDAEITPIVKKGLYAYTKNSAFNCSNEVNKAIGRAITNFIDMLIDDRTEFSNIIITPSVVASLLAKHLAIVNDSPDTFLDIIEEYAEASDQLINAYDDIDDDAEKEFSAILAEAEKEFSGTDCSEVMQ